MACHRRDIHARFEDNEFGKSSCAFGAILQDLSVATMDESWTAQYIDRTLPENRCRPLHKYLKIDGMGIYWKPCNATVVSHAKDDKEADRLMGEGMKEAMKLNYVLRPCSFLLTSSEAGDQVRAEREHARLQKPAILRHVLHRLSRSQHEEESV